MGIFDNSQSDLQKKAEAFGSPWPGRILGAILISAFLYFAFSLFSDFQTNKKIIAAGITGVVLFVALEFFKRGKD